jgi:hypothetical protein
MNKFVENAINWLAKKSEVKIASDEKQAISKYAETVKDIAPKDLASNQDINVYYVDVDTKFDEESVKAVHDFVENGGGLLVAGHCYSCVYENLKPSDLPGNKYVVCPKLTEALFKWMNFYPEKTIDHKKYILL